MSDSPVLYRIRQTKRYDQHLRSRRFGVIVLVFLLMCIAGGMSIKAIMDKSLWWGITAQLERNGTWTVTWFDTWSIAIANRLQPGDHILLADGRRPTSETDINQAASLVYLHNGEEQTLHWPVPIDTWPLSISWLICGMISFVVGALVFQHATDRRLALRFFLLWSVFALLAALEPGADWGHPTEAMLAEVLATGLLFPMLVSFLWWLFFPDGNLHRHWVRDLSIILGGVWGLSSLVNDLIHLVLLTRVLGATQGVLDVGCILLSFWFILRMCFSRQREQAERARILLGGVLLGLLPVLFLTLIPTMFSGDSSNGPMTGIFGVFLPLSFAYVSIKRDLLHLDSLIRRSAHVAIAGVGMTILALMVTQVLLRLPTPLNALVGMLAGAILLPLTWWASRWAAEFWLFPQLRSYRRLVARGMGNDANQELTPTNLAKQLADLVREKLPVEQNRIAVFLLDAQGEGFTALAADFPPIKVDYQLYLALKQSHAPVLVEPGELESTPAWHLLVPFRHRRLVGVLALGQREDGQDFSETDLQLLRLLVETRAALFEYALLGTDLHSALQELRRYEQINSAVARGTSLLLADPLSLVRQQLAALQSLTPHELARQPDIQQAMQQLERSVQAVDEELHRLKTGVSYLVADQMQTHQSGDVRELVDQLIQQFEERLHRNQVTIRNLVQDGVIAQGNVTTIARCLWQLLSNALEASGPGKVIDVQGMVDEISLDRLKAFRQRGPLPNSQESEKRARLFDIGQEALAQRIPVAHVIVRDTGEPIRERDLLFLFDRFSSPEHEPPKRPGLPRCWEMIVESLGGGIWIESDTLTGQTACHLVLPIANAEPPRSEKERRDYATMNGNYSEKQGQSSHFSQLL